MILYDVTRCNTKWYDILGYDMNDIWCYNMIWQDTIQYIIWYERYICYNTILQDAIQCDKMWCCDMIYMYSRIWYNMMQCDTWSDVIMLPPNMW